MNMVMIHKSAVNKPFVQQLLFSSTRYFYEMLIRQRGSNITSHSKQRQGRFAVNYLTFLCMLAMEIAG